MVERTVSNSFFCGKVLLLVILLSAEWPKASCIGKRRKREERKKERKEKKKKEKRKKKRKKKKGRKEQKKDEKEKAKERKGKNGWGKQTEIKKQNKQTNKRGSIF